MANVVCYHNIIKNCLNLHKEVFFQELTDADVTRSLDRISHATMTLLLTRGSLGPASPHHTSGIHLAWLVGVEFNAPLDTVHVWPDVPYTFQWTQISLAKLPLP